MKPELLVSQNEPKNIKQTFSREIHSSTGKCESPAVSQPNGGPKAKRIKLQVYNRVHAKTGWSGHSDSFCQVFQSQFCTSFHFINQCNFEFVHFGANSVSSHEWMWDQHLLCHLYGQRHLSPQKGFQLGEFRTNLSSKK